MLYLDRIQTPIGTVVVVADPQALCSLDFADDEAHMSALLQRRYGRAALVPYADLHGFSSRIRAYFAGDLFAIDDLPVRPDGTPFQQQVWAALRTIPAGTTRSYGHLAQALGKPQAARAVGRANALNPISLVIPCHRLIGANATLTGYGGGLERKAWLLRHEGALR